MTRRPLALALAAVTLGVAACGGSDSSSSGGNATATATATSTSTPSSSSTGAANTADVVKAAKAFLGTLSTSQKSSVVFDFGDDQVKNSWSNLPAALAPRKGIALGDMSSKQSKAALTLMDTVLSDQGYQQLEDTRAADDYLAANGGNSGGAPGGGAAYGGGNYYFAFYGEPSTSKQWLLQYTGHHLTYNVSYKGDKVTFAPAFEGVEPKAFDKAGRTIAPVNDAAGALSGVIKALSSSQRSKAELSKSYDDLLLGAQNDGPFLSSPEGVTVSELSKRAQGEVTAAIKAYVGDLDERAAAKLMSAYTGAYETTKFAYAGGTDVTAEGFYARIDGPEVWIEFSTQRGVVLSGSHYHSIYRAEGSDYGGS